MNDVPEVVRAYYPYAVIDETSENYLSFTLLFSDNDVRAVIKSSFLSPAEHFLTIKKEEGLQYKKITKRFAKIILYHYMKELTGVTLPYGSLTGVRPTKLFYELTESGEDAERYLAENFFVAEDRANLISDVVKNQRGIYNRDPNGVDIYVNVPFCPTRCAYCSFISTEAGRVKKRLPEYARAVAKELEDIKNRIADGGYHVRSIYVGGGTPTSLDADLLYQMLKGLSYYGVEFTVEAGRPDSITAEKLDAIAALNATRISVNPQTLKGETLELMGRNHTPEDFFNAYSLVRKYPFLINCDLIAGLPGESYEDFTSSLDGVISLHPDNITVHTLSIKRGAVFKLNGTEKSVSGQVKEMTDYARAKLSLSGYSPYYMYRQKNMADNLENVGYCKPGKQCIYNVDYMEETNTIFSAGAGAVSKLVSLENNRIERYSDPKGLNEYLEKFKA